MTATLCRAARSRVRSRSSCSAHSATFAPNVVGSAWMPWVRPIITVSRWVRDNSHEHAQQVGRGIDQQVGGVTQRPATCGVDDVGRREPVVDPRRRRRPDRRLDDVDERSDVVVGDGLAVEHRLHERLVGDRRAGPTGRAHRRPVRARTLRGPRWRAARLRANDRIVRCRTTPRPSPGWSSAGSSPHRHDDHTR